MKRVDSLTSLRFFAIMGIYFHHFDTFSAQMIENNNMLSNILFEGFIGVTFFYILSGFVITYAYQDRLLENRLSKTKFLYSRLTKVWPLHILCVAIASIVYGNLQSLFSGRAVPVIFLFQSFIPNSGYNFSFNGVSWSLSDELFFYIIFTGLIYLSTKNLIKVFLSLFAIILFYGYWIGMTLEMSGWIFYINPFFRCIDFIGGILLYRATKSCKIKEIMKNKQIATILEGSSLLLLFICIMLGIYQRVNLLWRFDIFYLFPMMFIVLVFSYNAGRLSKLLSHRFFVSLGNASFAFYLIHQIVLVIISRTFLIDTWKKAFLYGVAALPILWALSILLTKFIEKPVAVGLNRFWDNMNGLLKANSKDNQ